MAAGCQPEEGDGVSVRVKHHSKGYAALLKHPNVQTDLEQRARRIAAAANDPDILYESSVPIHTRARAAVVAPIGDPENKIIHALDAGR